MSYFEKNDETKQNESEEKTEKTSASKFGLISKQRIFLSSLY